MYQSERDFSTRTIRRVTMRIMRLGTSTPSIYAVVIWIEKNIGGCGWAAVPSLSTMRVSRSEAIR